MKYSIYYIAGISDTTIYLGNVTAPASLLLAGPALQTSHTIDLAIPTGLRLRINGIRAHIVNSLLYLVDTKTSTVLQVGLNTYSFIRLHKLKVDNLDDVRQISESTFICKTFNAVARRSEIIKISSAGILTADSPILKGQIDESFSTDGQLMFSPYSRRLLYIYYYRNQYLCIDSNLKIQSSGRTIDTNSIAKIRLDSFSSAQSKLLQLVMKNRKF